MHAVLGDHSTALVTESHRSLQTRTLLTHSTALVRLILLESHSLSTSLSTASSIFNTQVQPSDGQIAELTISALALTRNKRALLVYHRQRMDTLKDRYWDKGGVLRDAFGAETECRKHMVPVDEAFAKGYSELCLAFKTSWYGADEDERQGGRGGVQLMDALDLMGGGTAAEPPKDLMVSIRVLKDIGEVEMISGSRMSLDFGCQYYLPREEVEGLVVSGLVEIIDG